MVIEPSHIVVKRTWAERGLIRYESYGYGNTLAEACDIAKEYPSKTDVGDILIVCDLAHVSSPEENAKHIYVSNAHGSIMEAKIVPSILKYDVHDNWFDVWGGKYSSSVIMFDYVKRIRDGVADQIMIECERAFNLKTRSSYKLYWISDLIEEIVTAKISDVKSTDRLFTQIIADVFPIHKVLLL